MREKFSNWMVRYEEKSPNTAYQYALSIKKITNHYNEQTKENFDLYQSNDLEKIREISTKYGINGIYREFGQTGNGTVRNAIATYVRFLEQSGNNNENYLAQENDNNCESNAEPMNFTYERDLQNALISQVENLFSEYKIFGSNKEGVEYSIGGKRIDLLLEHKKEDKLLVIELKAGLADYKVFGQISMYIGLLEEKYPDKEISGIIIASEIDESLIKASKITTRVSLKAYRMQLAIEGVS